MDLNFPFQRNGKFYKEEKNNISLLFKAGIESKLPILGHPFLDGRQQAPV